MSPFFHARATGLTVKYVKTDISNYIVPILGTMVMDVMIKYSPLIREKIVFIPEAKVKVDLFISCAGLEPNGLIHSNIACKHIQSN